MDRQEKKRIQQILDILSRLYPDARTGLKYQTPFQLLVATILSAQCSDRQVNKTTSRLFQKYRTPEDFAGLSPEELAFEIKDCGLYRNKSKNIIAASKMLVERYNSRVPETFAELEQLPGVGHKTANVILGVAFHQPTLPVDTHVFRVTHRLGLARGKTPEQTEKELLNLIPPQYRQAAHHQFIAHGRQVCSARRPRCDSCGLALLCPAKGNFYCHVSHCFL